MIWIFFRSLSLFAECFRWVFSRVYGELLYNSTLHKWIKCSPWGWIQMKWGRRIWDAFRIAAVLTGGEYSNQNKLLPCSYPAVLMRDGCTQGGTSTIATAAGSFSVNWINICCAAQNVRQLKSLYTRGAKQISLQTLLFFFFFIVYSLSGIFSDLIRHTYPCVRRSNYVSRLITCVYPRAGVRVIEGVSCSLQEARAGNLAPWESICIYEGSRPPVVRANSTEGFSKSLERMGGGIITNTDWWLLMSGHEASWRFVATPQHEISKKVEDRTYFCFFWLPLNRIKTHTQTSAGFTWTQLTLQCLKSKHLHWNTHARTHNTHRPEAIFWHVISDYSKK